METFSYFSGNSIDYQNFVSYSSILPANESFYIALAIGMVEAFARVKNSNLSQPSWTNFKKHILALQKIDSQSKYSDSIGILLSFCNIIETMPIEEGLKSINYYAVNNESSLLEHITNCIKGIFYDLFSLDPSIVLTQNGLDILSQKFNIYIAIYSNENTLISYTSVLLPAVYLLKYEYENNIYYGNLIPKEFLNINDETIIDENSIPIVNINQKIDEDNDYKDVSKYTNFDNNKPLEVVKEESLIVVKDDQKSDEIDLKDKYAKELISYMLEVLGNKILTEDCAKKIIKAAEEDGYKDENIDKITAQAEDKDHGISYFNYSSSKKKCNKCANVLKETFPIRLTCQNTSLCVDCIVDNYKNTYTNKCPDCQRVYSEEELNLINSFT
ncbi:hypothetical protein SteCoe_8616 [Stentor coeruleus]|uniref:RING-type domain-containing protein n=1 Tax=Stentor coeruleus TaxID=5963 RepID=A0A1R2CJU3_9CILI|nr:hypothetical protein SteCoe_8616 [Stentor coeruleus]